jgi:dTMP kinase
VRGRFITFEGGEGVGKSTQVGRAAAWLRTSGRDVVVTREPGGTPRAERLRELLLERSAEPMPPACELLLMFAARATHVANLIEPALTRGAWVLCDRFTDASHAYQGGGRGIAQWHIDALAKLAHPGLTPDLTVLLDAPVALGLRRAGARQAPAADRFEAEHLEFFERVRDAYLERARLEPERIRIVDAARTIDEVETAVRSALGPLLT